MGQIAYSMWNSAKYAQMYAYHHRISHAIEWMKVFREFSGNKHTQTNNKLRQCREEWEYNRGGTEHTMGPQYNFNKWGKYFELFVVCAAYIWERNYFFFDIRFFSKKHNEEECTQKRGMGPSGIRRNFVLFTQIPLWKCWKTWRKISIELLQL